MTATTVNTHAILARLACLLRDGGVDADHLPETGVRVTCGPDGRAVGFEAMESAWQASLYLDPSGADGVIDRFPLHAPDGEILLLTCHADTLYHVAHTICEMWARQAPKSTAARPSAAPAAPAVKRIRSSPRPTASSASRGRPAPAAPSR